MPHNQINNIVNRIKEAVLQQKESFIPWDGDNSFSISYHHKKGYLKVNEYEYVKTIDDAFALFGAKGKRRGFLRKCIAEIPDNVNELVWCPRCGHKYWHNELSEDGKVILEYSKKGEDERLKHLEDNLSKPSKRITFFRIDDGDELGFKLYRFVGIFQLNVKRSIEEKMCVWERVSDTYRFNTNQML